MTDFNKITASNLGNWKDQPAAGGCRDDDGSDSGKGEVGCGFLRYLYKYLVNLLLYSDI